VTPPDALYQAELAACRSVIRKLIDERAHLQDEVERLAVLVSKHHAVGVLEGARTGDLCPVCFAGREP